MKNLRKSFLSCLWRSTTPPHGYATAEEWVRENLPEDLLLSRIFDGKRRFLWPSWWAKRIVVWMLP